MTCASEATGTASPASANENKITEEARRIPIPSRLSIVIARLRAKCREIKAHLMIVDRSPEPAFVVRTASRFMRELHCSEPAGLAEVHCFLRCRPSFPPARFSMPRPAIRRASSFVSSLVADRGRRASKRVAFDPGWIKNRSFGVRRARGEDFRRHGKSGRREAGRVRTRHAQVSGKFMV